MQRLPNPDRWRRRALLAALAALATLPAAAADRDKEGEEPLVPGVPVYFDLPAIILPVVEGNAVTRQIGAMLTVELAEGHRKSEAAAKRRELTDAFITELYRIYGWRSSADRVVDEMLVKQRLLVAANRVLGNGVAHAILIRQLVEQQR